MPFLVLLTTNATALAATALSPIAEVKSPADPKKQSSQLPYNCTRSLTVKFKESNTGHIE